jgi:hypothetical protein
LHAVVVRVRINDGERAQQALESEVVPRVSAAPGFEAGYWTRAADGGDNGLSMILFDSESNARAAAEQIPNGIPDAVSLEDVQVREVVASA